MPYASLFLPIAGTVAAPSHSGRVQDLMPMYYRRLFPYDDMIQARSRPFGAFLNA